MLQRCIKWPHGHWLYTSFVQILRQERQHVHGDVNIDMKATWRCNLESIQSSIARTIHAVEALYNVEARIRHKFGRWRLSTPIGVATRRVVVSLSIIHQRCPRRVCVVYLRTLFNDWVTRRRMRTITGKPARIHSFVCGGEEESRELQHTLAA